MGIALSAFNSLFAPLGSLLGWLPVSSVPVPAAARARAPSAFGSPSACGIPSARPQPLKGARNECARAQRPLRVVRLLDQGAAATAGRMVISGRMADVCAELDRLAAAETCSSLKH